MWLLHHPHAFRQHQRDSGAWRFLLHSSVESTWVFGVLVLQALVAADRETRSPAELQPRPLRYLQTIPEAIYFICCFLELSVLSAAAVTAVSCHRRESAVSPRWQDGRGNVRTKQNKEGAEVDQRSPNYLHMWHRTWSWPRKISPQQELQTTNNNKYLKVFHYFKRQKQVGLKIKSIFKQPDLKNA